jgi:methyl-accepting chemotaxis protein
MTIQQKLIGSLLMIFLLIIISLCVYIFMMSPVGTMRTEEKKLFDLKNSFQEELRLFNNLVIQSFEFAYMDYQETIKKTDSSFKAISDLKVLPKKSKEIAKAIKIITDMKHLIDERRGRLIKSINKILDDAKDVLYFTKSFSYLSFIQSNRLKRHKNYNSYSDDLSAFISDLLIMIDSLKTSMDVIDEQSEKISEEIIKVETSSQLLSLIIGGIIFLLAFLFAFFTIKRIIKNIHILDNTIIYLKKGDLTNSFKVLSKDELGRLSKTLNQFLEHLKSTIQMIQKASKKSILTRDQLLSSLNDSALSVSQINNSVETIKKQSDNLSDYVKKSRESIDLIVGLIEELNHMIEDQVAMIEESTTSVTQIITSLQSIAKTVEKDHTTTENLVKKARVGGQKLDEMSTMIKRISDSVNQIQGIADLIQDIASQTDLLAMNAAIEAAHAGAAGKGFAVVADEIRKLAVASSNNSKEISQKVKSIISHILEADRASEDTGFAFQEINDGVDQVSNSFTEIADSMIELKTGGSQILEAMQHLREYSLNVKTNSEKINESTKVVIKSVKNVQDVSQEVRNGSGEIVSGMEIIRSSIGITKNLSERIHQVSGNLDSIVGRFITSSREKDDAPSKPQTE